MPTPSSTSLAEALLQEFITLGADTLIFRENGDDAKFAFVVGAHLTKEPERVISDFKGLLGQLKAMVTEMDYEDENDWRGHFRFFFQGKEYWVQPDYFRSDKGANITVSILGDLLSLSQLELSNRDREILEELISFPSGVIVGCGGGFDGHSTTFKALLQTLANSGKRVASFNWSDPRLQGVSQFDIKKENWREQVMSLASDFEVVALGCLNERGNREAIDLAARGHLVLGLVYGWSATSPLSGVLRADVSPDEIRAHFLRKPSSGKPAVKDESGCSTA